MWSIQVCPMDTDISHILKFIKNFKHFFNAIFVKTLNSPLVFQTVSVEFPSAGRGAEDRPHDGELCSEIL